MREGGKLLLCTEFFMVVIGEFRWVKGLWREVFILFVIVLREVYFYEDI